LKGGGSVSGRLWNNNQRAVSGKVPGIGAKGVDKFQGNIRGRKGFVPQGEEYTGNIKARRPLKGGGSVSGKLWNNNQRAVSGKVPGIGAKGIDAYRGNIRGRKGFVPQGEEYTGDIKARRPLKGGGSVSGKLWNNNGRAINGKVPGIGAKGIDLYAGNIKAKKPLKGGGSISGKLWNNKEKPIPGKEPGIGAKGIDLFAGNLKPRPKGPSANDRKVSGYPGKLKKFEVHPGFGDQGEEYTGSIKAKRKYVQNPNSSDESLKKLKPTSNTYQTAGLQVRVREPLYAKGKKSPADAVDVRQPGKAFARATDYQGNIKMKKFDLFGRRDLHPDSKFVRTNKNNVANEKDVVTNFKLWWARLFKKNDNQPQHLKDKSGKPRYDKREVGLWYD
jgi:hypothetical protein